MEEIRNEKNSSISVSRTTKGAYSWDLKIYYNESETSGSIIIAKLKMLDDTMKQEFKGRDE